MSNSSWNQFDWTRVHSEYSRLTGHAMNDSDHVFIEWISTAYQAERNGDRQSIRIGPFSAMLMISAMQLAMRHPDLLETHRDMLRQIIEQFRPWFADTPADALITRGYNVEFNPSKGSE